MIECWRWFGPGDPIRPADITQTGAVGVVIALYDIPYGEVWSPGASARWPRDPASTGRSSKACPSTRTSAG